MKEFIVKHPVVILLSTITVCECVVRCCKIAAKKNKNKKETSKE